MKTAKWITPIVMGVLTAIQLPWTLAHPTTFNVVILTSNAVVFGFCLGLRIAVWAAGRA